MKYLCYLAAGSAARFGENKLLYPVNGKPLFLHGLTVLSQIAKEREDCRLLVVSRYEKILGAAEAHGAQPVDSPDSEKGMSHTVRCAVKACGELSIGDRLLFVCADQPYLTADTVGRILDTADLLSDTASGTAPLAACAAFGEREGNPVLFSACLADALCALTGDKGGKAVLKQYPGRCMRVFCKTEKELADIDTKEDVFPNKDR